MTCGSDYHYKSTVPDKQSQELNNNIPLMNSLQFPLPLQVLSTQRVTKTSTDTIGSVIQASLLLKNNIRTR
jgi:hypothetical protein